MSSPTSPASTLQQESELLRKTITNLMGQLDSAQKRMQQVFSQSNNVVSQLAERERQMSTRVRQQHQRMKEIIRDNNSQKKCKNKSKPNQKKKCGSYNGKNEDDQRGAAGRGDDDDDDGDENVADNNDNENDDDEGDNDNDDTSLAGRQRNFLRSSNRVRLNVGGRIFETTKKILTKYPGTMFDLLLSGDYPVEMDEKDKSIFLDRDPDVFAHILRYLRTGIIPTGFLSECDLSRALRDGENEQDAAEVEEYLNFLHFRETTNNNHNQQHQQHQLRLGHEEVEEGAGIQPPPLLPGNATTSSFVGGARAAAENINNLSNSNNNNNNNNNAVVAANDVQSGLNVHNNNSNVLAPSTIVAASSSLQQNQGQSSSTSCPVATATTTTSLWNEYSLAQRHYLLEMEARYFMLDELLLKLSRNRMRWFACAQRAKPTPRCFSTMQVVGSNGYVFGGCSASDHFFDDLYRVCLHPTAATTNDSNNCRHRQVSSGDDDDDDQEDDDNDRDHDDGHDEKDGSDDRRTQISKRSRGKSSSSSSSSRETRQEKQPTNTASNADPISSSSIDTASLAYYKGPFEWDRVVTRKGQIPEPRSGHTMNIVPAVTNFHTSMTNTRVSYNNNNNNNSSSDDDRTSNNTRQQQQEDVYNADEDYHPEGGLLVLFGNDRSRMLSNAIVFDIDESAWRNVRQVAAGSNTNNSKTASPSRSFPGGNNNNNNNNNTDNNINNSYNHRANSVPLPRSGHSFTLISPSKRSSEKQRFVLIGGKQIFPETTHYDDVYFAEYDPFNLTLAWSQANVINNNHHAHNTVAAHLLGGMHNSNSSHVRDEGPSDTIEPRSYHSAVFREQDGLVYIFGGIINNVYSNELCTFNPTNGVWRTITNTSLAAELPSHLHNSNFGLQVIPSYLPPAPRSGHIAFIVDHGERMLVAGSYSEETEELTVGMLTFATMKWTTAKVDPRFGGHVETPSRRAAISGCYLPALTGGAGSRLPMMVVFGGFELSARKCFNDLYVLPL